MRPRMEVNNVKDLMVQAAEALEDGDLETLEELMRISEDWLQDRESRNAQIVMLESMCAAIEYMED